MVKIQLTDVNDNRPVFYPREYNVSLREGGAYSSTTTPVVVVAATDADSGRFGAVSYRIVAGNEAGLFRIDKSTGEVFVSRPSLLSTRAHPYHRLNVSAVDGGGLRAGADAELFISVIDSAQRPPLFERARYTFALNEDVQRGALVGSVRAVVGESGELVICDADTINNTNVRESHLWWNKTTGRSNGMADVFCINRRRVCVCGGACACARFAPLPAPPNPTTRLARIVGDLVLRAEFSAPP